MQPDASHVEGLRLVAAGKQELRQPHLGQSAVVVHGADPQCGAQDGDGFGSPTGPPQTCGVGVQQGVGWLTARSTEVHGGEAQGVCGGLTGQEAGVGEIVAAASGTA